MERINVLIYPSGAENSLEIHAALKSIMDVKIFGATAVEDHTEYVYKNHTSAAPRITDADFIDRLNAIISMYSIDVVIPTHDDVSLQLAKISDEINAKIAVPGVRQAEICRSKKLTYELFSDMDFIPRIFEDINEKDLPLFAKPDKGQGGKGASVIERMADLERLERPQDFVLTEFLPGNEFTVDCFSDKNGKLRFIGPRSRDRVFAGVAVRSTRVPVSNEIEKIAVIIHERLSLRGAWYFQLKEDQYGLLKLMEISIRMAGTMNLYRALGVNFPLLTVYDLLDMEISVLANGFQLQVDRALFNRYKAEIDYDTVYIDYDDTIVDTIEEKVNGFVMMLLYQFKNEGKTVHLLTKHRFDLEENMRKYRIPIELFDSIIHLLPDRSKSSSIDPRSKAIFVDNAFSERLSVHKALGIPVFDVDAVGVLIDWKE